MKDQVALAGLSAILFGAYKTYNGLFYGGGDSLPVFGATLLMLGVIICHQSSRFGDRKGLSGRQGCAFFITLGVVWISWQIGSCNTNHSPSPSQAAPANSAPAGKVDLAGRVMPGSKVYTKTGVFFGTVVRQVVQHRGEECVEIRLEGGELFYLSRGAIRQGNTWFTDP